jgi:hypothetical protein
VTPYTRTIEPTRVWVTIDGVWIGDWIYWPFTDRKYNSITNFHTLQITTAHAKPSQSAFSSCFPVTNLKNGGSSASMLMSLSSGKYHTTEPKWVLSLILWPMVSRPVCLGIKHMYGAYDQIFINVRQLLVCWCGALSLMRGQVCHLQLLLALARANIFGSNFCGTCDHNFLSQIRDFLFRHLLWLAGLRWRYSTPPPHGTLEFTNQIPFYNFPQTMWKSSPSRVLRAKL